MAVHGLNGHREKTFTADNGVCWLRDTLPAMVPKLKIRVLSYGYDARTHSTSPLSSKHLLDHAENFLETLTMERDLTEVLKEFKKPRGTVLTVLRRPPNVLSFLSHIALVVSL